MAKTIEEMAIDYGYKHMGCCDIEDFEAGANAVLEEIEQALEKDNDSEDLSLTCRNLYLKIRELKGEE